MLAVRLQNQAAMGHAEGRMVVLVLLVAIATALAEPARSASDGAQPVEPTAAEALQQATDPVPTTTQLTLQPEYTFPHGTSNGVAQLLFQPIVPYDGFFIPAVDVPGFRSIARMQVSGGTVSSGASSVAGLDDLLVLDGIVRSLGPVEVGVGFTTVLPTATRSELGQGKWQVGPSAIVAIPGLPSLQVGAVVQVLWSVAGDREQPALAYTMIQPVVVVLLPKACSVFTNDQLSVYWRGPGTTVPINLGFGHAFGAHFVAQLQAAYTVWGVGKGSPQATLVLNVQL